jgi:hypothetical protein
LPSLNESEILLLIQNNAPKPAYKKEQEFKARLTEIENKINATIMQTKDLEVVSQ